MKKLLFISSILILCLNACKKGTKNAYDQIQKQLTEKTDSINYFKKEVVELNKLLVTRFENLCDTLTPEERIKLLKYEQFENETFNKKENALTNLSTQKESATTKAYMSKEGQTTKNFLDARNSIIPFYKKWDKDDHQTFVEYAILSFYDNESGDFNHNAYDKKKLIEKTKSTPIMLMVSARQQADSIKKEKDAVAEAQYKQICENIELQYTLDVQKTELNYLNACAAKKLELGIK